MNDMDNCKPIIPEYDCIKRGIKEKVLCSKSVWLIKIKRGNVYVTRRVLADCLPEALSFFNEDAKNLIIDIKMESDYKVDFYMMYEGKI
jgi:hypothetical protein